MSCRLCQTLSGPLLQSGSPAREARGAAAKLLKMGRNARQCRLSTYRHRFARAAPAPRAKRKIQRIVDVHRPSRCEVRSPVYPTCCPLVRFPKGASKMLRATGHARMVKLGKFKTTIFQFLSRLNHDRRQQVLCQASKPAFRSHGVRPTAGELTCM